MNNHWAGILSDLALVSSSSLSLILSGLLALFGLSLANDQERCLHLLLGLRLTFWMHFWAAFLSFISWLFYGYVVVEAMVASCKGFLFTSRYLHFFYTYGGRLLRKKHKMTLINKINSLSRWLKHWQH